MSETQPLLWEYPKSNTRLQKILLVIAIINTGFLILIYEKNDPHKNISCSNACKNIPNNISLDKTQWIYIIRHCEKGKDSDMGLSRTGVEHSNCLIDYFKNFPEGMPEVAHSETSRTERSIHTLIPVQIELGIPLYSYWRSNKIKKEVHSIKSSLERYNRIVVAWEHHTIPELATALGCTVCNSWNENPLLHKMNDDLYNVTWVLKLENNTVTLRVYNQNFINHSCIKDFNYTYEEIV